MKDVMDYTDIVGGKLLEKLIANGALATFQLAYAYDTGEGMPKNVEKALEYYKKGVEKGDPAAAKNLMFLYQKLGRKESGKEYLMEMAEKGNLAARELLVLLRSQFCQKSFQGDKLSQEHMKWLKECADADYTQSLLLLGNIYNPYDVSHKYFIYPAGYYRDAEKAYKCYKRAVELGVDDAEEMVQKYDERACPYCGRPGALYYPESAFKTKMRCRYCGKKAKN